MDPRVASEIERRLGPGTSWGFYDRQARTPLNVLLDDVAERLGRDLVLAWLDGGAPTAFAVTGFPVAVAAWSTRHLEISAAVRNLIVDGRFTRDIRRDLSRRLVLSVASELLLRDGRQQEAARCLLLAVRGQALVLPYTNVLADLESASLDEAYAGLWFFAVAHEFGHALPPGSSPDDAVLHRLTVEALGSIPALAENPDVLAELIPKIDTDLQNPNRPRRLRAEMAADGFAVESVITSATACAAREGRTLAAGKLVAEIMLAHAEISLIERCRALTRTPTHGVASISSIQFHTTASLAVRSWFVQELLLGILGAGRPEGWFSAVDDLLGTLAESVAVVDSGLADAMRQMISPPVDELLLADVRSEFRDPSHRALLSVEHALFVSSAKDSLGTLRRQGRADPLLEATIEMFAGSMW